MQNTTIPTRHRIETEGALALLCSARSVSLPGRHLVSQSLRARAVSQQVCLFLRERKAPCSARAQLSSAPPRFAGILSPWSRPRHEDAINNRPARQHLRHSALGLARAWREKNNHGNSISPSVPLCRLIGVGRPAELMGWDWGSWRHFGSVSVSGAQLPVWPRHLTSLRVSLAPLHSMRACREMGRVQ